MQLQYPYPKGHMDMWPLVIFYEKISFLPEE